MERYSIIKNMAMKRLLGSALFKRFQYLRAGENITCQFHDNKRLPNIRALGNIIFKIELCVTCQMHCCYMCGNHHVDHHCAVDCIV